MRECFRTNVKTSSINEIKQNNQQALWNDINQDISVGHPIYIIEKAQEFIIAHNNLFKSTDFDILTWRYVLGQKFSDIGKKLNIPTSSVGHRLYSILDTLNKYAKTVAKFSKYSRVEVTDRKPINVKERLEVVRLLSNETDKDIRRELKKLLRDLSESEV